MNTELQSYQDRAPFEPREHLMQIPNKNGKADYLPVQWRLVWFREQCPDGVIETEMVHLDLDRETEEEGYAWNAETRRSEKVMKRANGLAIFRATVRDGKGGTATGTKSEKAAAFPDFIEKAETGAIGRALAALGYGTQFAPELNEEHRIVDAPAERTEQDRRAYTERKPFVESTVAKKPLLNGDGSPAFPEKHSLMEVKEFFLKYFKPTQWRGFKDAEIGSSVEDEGLSESELAKLWARLVVIDEDAKARGSKATAAAN